MRKLERFNLLDQIGRDLQSRMRYVDIDVFLKSFGVDIKKETSSTNSKWVYVKELLSDASDSLILQIADELEIPHGHTIGPSVVSEDSRFWIPGHFRLFISHLSEHRDRALALKESLKKYAISCFVAHDDIDPTLEWQNEIEKALASMDALAVILMPGLHKSKWADQEIGYALGRGSLVVPLRNGLDPYGFIGKLQGVPCKGRKVSQVAAGVFHALSCNRATKAKLATVLVDQIVAPSTSTPARQLLSRLREIEALPQGYLERLRDNLGANTPPATDPEFIRELNSLLSERGSAPYEVPLQEEVLDEEIPF